jgi:hypothetical protein
MPDKDTPQAEVKTRDVTTTETKVADADEVMRTDSGAVASRNAEAPTLEDGSPPTEWNIARLNEQRAARLTRELTDDEHESFKRLSERKYSDLSPQDRLLLAELEARIGYKALDRYTGPLHALEEPQGVRHVGGHYVMPDGRHVNAEGRQLEVKRDGTVVGVKH